MQKVDFFPSLFFPRVIPKWKYCLCFPLQGTSLGPNVTSPFKFSCGFACRRQAVLRKTIFLPTCVWKSTGSRVTYRWAASPGQTPAVLFYVKGFSLNFLYLFVFQGYLPPTKNGVEPKRPSRPINITSLVRLSTTVPNTIVVSWTAEIGRVGTEPVLWIVRDAALSVIFKHRLPKTSKKWNFTNITLEFYF